MRPGTGYRRLVRGGRAATQIWNGGGTDDYWTDAANWGGTAPAAGSESDFGSTTHVSNVNNLAAGTSFYALEFQSAAPSYTLTGNSLGITEGVYNFSSAPRRWRCPSTS